MILVVVNKAVIRFLKFSNLFLLKLEFDLLFFHTFTPLIFKVEVFNNSFIVCLFWYPFCCFNDVDFTSYLLSWWLISVVVMIYMEYFESDTTPLVGCRRNTKNRLLRLRKVLEFNHINQGVCRLGNLGSCILTTFFRFSVFFSFILHFRITRFSP